MRLTTLFFLAVFTCHLSLYADEKIVIVTGAFSGLGKDIAESFGRDPSYKVYATGRYTEKAEFPAGIIPLRMDVADSESVKRAIEQIVDTEGRIDVVVNNAAYAVVGVLESISEEQLMNMFNVNTFGPHRVMAAALPHMRAQGGGRFINISSTSGIRPLPGLGAYAATKFALEAITEAAAVEYASKQIQFTLVEAGAIKNQWSHRAVVGELGLAHAPYVTFSEKLLEMFQQRAQVAQESTDIAALVVRVAKESNPPLRIQTSEMACSIAEGRWKDPTGAKAFESGVEFLHKNSFEL